MSTAKALAARVCNQQPCASVSRQLSAVSGGTHDNSVVPGKYCQLIEASNEIPSSGYVAGDEDSQGQDRKGVHRIARC